MMKKWRRQAEEDDAIFLSPLPPYISLRKPNSKPAKESKYMKYCTFTPLLQEEIPFKGEVLGKILQLKVVDYDFNDKKKYRQFSPELYLK